MKSRPFQSYNGAMKLAAALFLLLLITGCARSGRFLPMSDNTALDTKTGRRCNPDPVLLKESGPQLPLCTTL